MFPIKRTVFLCTVTVHKNTVRLIGNIEYLKHQQKQEVSSGYINHKEKAFPQLSTQKTLTQRNNPTERMYLCPDCSPDQP